MLKKTIFFTFFQKKKEVHSSHLDGKSNFGRSDCIIVAIFECYYDMNNYYCIFTFSFIFLFIYFFMYFAFFFSSHLLLILFFFLSLFSLLSSIEFEIGVVVKLSLNFLANASALLFYLPCASTTWLLVIKIEEKIIKEGRKKHVT